MFPYGSGEHPLIMTFNHDEKPGVLAIEPHDHGWKGGPPLSPKHQGLVSGSPYRKCR